MIPSTPLALPSDDSVELHLSDAGELHLAVGSTKMALSLDAAYELQYQLAALLAEVELIDYAGDLNEYKRRSDSRLRESYEALTALTDYPRRNPKIQH